MTILHVISSMDAQGGGVSQAVRLLIAGSETGEQHEVVSCDPPNAVWLRDVSFPLHALGPGKLGYAYSPRLLSWLIINLPRFDAVVVHGLWLWPSFATWIALRKLETGKRKAERRPGVLPGRNHERTTNNPKPHVPRCFVMPHGMLDPYFQRAPERRLKAIRNWFYWKLIEHRVVNHADGLLFTCEEEMLVAREPFRPYRPKSEHVVGLGIEDPPPFSCAMQDAFAAKCPDLGDQPYLLFLSRIHPKKGVDILLRAYAQIVQEQSLSLRDSTSSNTEYPFRILPALVIAGPCHDPEYLRSLKQLVLDLSLPLNAQISPLNQTLCAPPVHFTEMLTGDAKWGALYGCDAFILPSHQENFGIAVVEALACGKPVLISNKVNIWREIEKDRAGTVRDDTVSGTKRLLDYWLQGAASYSPLKCFEENFHIKSAALKFINVLNSQRTLTGSLELMSTFSDDGTDKT